MNVADAPPSPQIRQVGLIHTVANLVNVFGELTATLIPDVSVIDVVDESLLRDAIAAGGLTADIEHRLARHVRSLADRGADAVMVTCSSLGLAVDRLAVAAPVPLMRVDSAMADEAVHNAARIGVLATLRTTMTPTAELVRDRAAQSGASVDVVAHLCDGAFDALKAGDIDSHDEMVRAGLHVLETQVDLIVLAQASMARVVLDGAIRTPLVPVLTSPRLAVERLAELVAARGQTAVARKRN